MEASVILKSHTLIRFSIVNLGIVGLLDTYASKIHAIEIQISKRGNLYMLLNVQYASTLKHLHITSR